MQNESLDLESLDLGVLGMLELGFMQKLECFAFQKTEQSIKIALRDSVQKELLAFHLDKKFANLCVEFCQIQDFDFFYQRALLQAEFWLLCENLKAKLALLQTNTYKNPNTQEGLEDSKEVKRLLDFILQEAIDSQSSDIHIELHTQNALVRKRIDGILQKSFVLEKNLFAVLSSRLKLQCNIDMTENRKALDGRFSQTFQDKEFDFRFSSVPTISGESLVIRILPKDIEVLELENLGFDTERLQIITSTLHKGSGVVILVGPTGCGKSTTLHAMLKSSQSSHKKILTIEDPIEYQVDSLTQILLNEQYDFGFNQALRSALRQDPDVMMIGEIRDLATLELAFQSALTGHLVLTTLHANNCLGALDRILGLGGKVDILASSLSLIIAQRLVRRLCKHCSIKASEGFYKEYKNGLYMGLIEQLQLDQKNLWRSVGCKHCQGYGFKGRIMINELLLNNESLSTFLRDQKKDLQDIKMFPMDVDAKNLLESGQSSIDEVHRVWW